MPPAYGEPDIAGAARPYPGETRNGDAWCVHVRDGTYRIALVDGAGHGAPAADAAAVAVALLDEHPEWDGQQAILACHRALQRTRGGVMTVATIDLVRNILVVAGVGNVESYLWMDGREQHLVTQRGMLGSTLPTLRPIEIALDPSWTFVLHSDGIRARFRLDDPALAPAATNSAAALASVILADFARPDDDATVLVVVQHG